MRDFHDQKELFKALDEIVQRRNERDGNLSYTRDLTWVTAHVYTVDVFLWVLARHGYTLQRSRKRVAFSNIARFIGDSKERWRKRAADVLGLGLGAAREGTRVAAQVDGEGSREANSR
jgi:hypothetical protein